MMIDFVSATWRAAGALAVAITLAAPAAIAGEPDDGRVVCGTAFVTVPILNAGELGLRSAQWLTIPKADIWWVALPDSMALWKADGFSVVTQVEIRVGRLGTAKTSEITAGTLLNCLD